MMTSNTDFKCDVIIVEQDVFRFKYFFFKLTSRFIVGNREKSTIVEGFMQKSIFLSRKMMHKITSLTINNNIAIANIQTGRNSDSIAGKNIKIISPVFLSATEEKMEQI